MKKAISFSLLLFLCLSAGHIYAQLIPQSVKMDKREGQFEIRSSTFINIEASDTAFNQVGRQLQTRIKSLSGLDLSTLMKRVESKNTILLQQVSMPILGREGYRLDVSPTRITIQSNTWVGAFYGMQSLMQFLPPYKNHDKMLVQAMEIVDYPRFSWRGMMLDVSRHFFTTETIKQTLDMLAFYKINTFHWHLCDNEGWRLEIKKYPKLTEVGAWRYDVPYARMYQKENLPTGIPQKYGGYYTQDEVREIVAYAKERNITVIPEIEMPGHSGAALASYPEYSCSQRPNTTPNSFLRHSDRSIKAHSLNYCAGNDSVFAFLEDVLTEVFHLFPSEYIHIGGDEVDKWDWEHCAKCQHRMKSEGLKDTHELQSYFIKRIEKFLLKNNRKLLGWDEILEGGLAKSATVMSWRGEKGGIEAAKMGHHVVMAPNNPLYFIRHQDSTDVEKFHAPTYSINSTDRVYAYDPHTAKLTSDERSYILGTQFSVWTEFMPSVEHLEYMIYPRMQAFAEVAWSPVSRKDFPNFVDRLNQYHFKMWNAKGVRFHKRLYRDNHY